MWAPAPASLGKLYSAPLQLAAGMTASLKSNTPLLNIPSTAASNDSNEGLRKTVFFLSFGLILDFTIKNPKAKMSIFISRNQKHLGYQFIYI